MGNNTISNNHNEWISFEETAKVLGVSKKTLSNYTTGANPRIPMQAMRMGIANKKFFHAPTIKGLYHISNN